MLTKALVRARVRGKTVSPDTIDPARADLRDVAEALVDVVEEAAVERWSQGRVKEALAEAGSAHKAPKVIKGLAKLLLDRCSFDVAVDVTPAELRALVFRRAREVGPLALERDATGRPTAADVLAEVAAELGISAGDAAGALYGDLKEEQALVTWRPITAAALLDRYNVALVQALLIQATKVEVRLGAATGPRTRQLLRHAKFRQLVVSARREGEGIVLTMDGPASLFSQSTRYGLQLAMFFPAVLLQDPPWSLEAEVLWTRGKHRKKLVITHEDGYVGHLADTGAYVTREHAAFVERWEATDTGPWTLSEDVLPIELGGHGVVLPDFALTDGERTAYLEIVGTWRKDWLARRIEGLRRHGPGNLVLAVSRKLRASKEALEDAPLEVVEFTSVVPVAAVIRAIEAVAR